MNVLCLFLLGSFVASVNTFITNTETSSYNQEETVSTCARNQFRCNSGHCIPANWHCDSHPDCDDNSDETAECQQNQNCRPEQFHCVFTKKCIPKGWVCDGEKDCGISSEYGQDLSDEDPKNCTKDLTCKWNEAPCGEGLECLPIKKFCDGHGDCLGNSDEWDFCQNQTITCNRLQCSFGCNQTPKGPKCYCPEGQKPEGAKCVDANECELDDSCAQLCTNTQGSFECSCVSGYKQNGTDCIAINIPASEPASLIFSTQSEIRRVTMEGKAFPGNSTLRLLNSNALEFVHRNHTVCYVHHNITKSSLMCANVDDLNDRWVVPALSPLIEVEAIQQIAVDWISQNWYFMDDQREVILVCSSDLRWCNILVESDLSKPIALCVDPTSGFLFFTKWGHSPPMVERINMDGSGRRPIVDHTIVYPYGVAVDFPTKQVYWVDTYLDYVERVDYNGQNRKTVIRGLKVQNLYGITLFQNKVFVSSWYNNSLLEVGKFSEEDKTIVSNISRPFNVYVFHRQRQPDVAHPCKSKNACDHLCIPSWNDQIALKKCICASGYTLLNSTACALKTPPTFLLLSRSAPFSIRAIDPASGADTVVPVTGIGRPKGLDFDAASNAVFFADALSRTVEMAPLNDTTARTVLLDDVLCDGLAFDWLARNLYWTSGAEGGTVGVAKLADPRVRRTLARSSNPTSIAVSPARGVMYWATWSSVSPEDGSIESAHMDGGGRRRFVVEDVHWPSGLAVDAAGGRVYWADKHLGIIQSVDFDGGSRRTEIANGVQSPVSVAVNTRLREHLFYIEMSKGSIMSYSNETGLRTIYEGNVPPFEIKLFDAEAQKTTGNHSCANTTCPELCLPIPGNKSVCACSDGFDWRNGACVKQANVTTPSSCAPGTFRCGHKKRCIPNTYLCDGKDNCGDGSDESAEAGGPCANVSCGENQMKCDNTTCIAKHWVCDGEKDCVDGSDENPEVCSKICSSAQFKCKQSRRCIPLVWRCDNVYDCGYGDHSDELDCNSTSCDVTEFTCKNGQCIAAGFYCDSVQDCDDGSDEVDCTSCDPAVEIPCKPLDKCLPRSAQCDGKVACPDGSDERDCGPKVECEPEEFVCTNFECIPKVFVCDSDLDCEDGSDEMKCDPMKLKNATESKKPIVNCDSPYRLCDNNTKCISLEKLCDNRQDCADGTDEGGRLCNDQNSTESKMALSCEYPSRTCDNDTKCITVDQLCDDRPDCVDGSDEGMRCADMLCDHSFLCSHDCHNAPEGLICTCPSHLHLQADKTHCLETHPCQAWDVCSQICIPRGSRYKCTCQNGYVMQEDGFTCKSTDSGRPFVVFSNRHEIRGIDLHTFNLKSFIPSLKNTITLDFYHANGTDMIFWTDVIDDKIYRGTVIGGSLGNIEVVVQSGLSTAEGLAVDWIGRNLYWVESNLDQIEVAKLNGSYRRTLVAGDMESPRAVAVDPRDGYLFWTDWDNLLPRIERCSMAGSDRRIVVKVNNNGWPNGLTLDYTTRRIYWIDARSDSIHTSDYEGGDHHEVMRNHEMLSHPFAITVFENYVYWTDWRTNSVVRANKWTGGDVKVMQKTLTQPFDVKIMHPSRQPRDGADPCGGDHNGGCSHLCLLHLNGTYKCDCPHIMKLGDDAKTCVVNDKVLLISRNSEIRGVDIAQPYYHTIPTISIPQVFVPVQLEYLARNNTLYWADAHINEVKRSSLTHGPSETLIDTGLHNPTGIAVDWASDLLFVSSKSGVTVTNLNGEYSLGLVEATSVSCIAIHPQLGRIFWIGAANGTEYLESSAMDGSARRVIARLEKSHSKSLTVDAAASKLYWIDGNEVFYADLDGRAVRKLPLDGPANISALTVYRDALYYANDTDSSIHSVDKRTGESDEVLRNGTGGVLALKIYDPKEQTGGSHPCGDRQRRCQHLCLPSNATSFSCACATGYRVHPRDPAKCEGVEEFLLYSLNWELRGLPLDGGAAQVLGPISRISSATAIDFAAEQELIYWADSDRGAVSRVRRDGTARQQVLEQSEVMENWLTGIAVDWVAGNVYWCDSKRGTVEVARLDGSTSHVLLPYETGKISSIAVDPAKGWLVWAGGWKMEIATMDGQNRRVLVEDAKAIADVALDAGNGFVYFSDVQSNTIERIGYDGKGREVMLNHSLENPVALTVFMGKVYWLDASHLSGSIKAAPITNMSAFDVLESNLNDSLKDIQIFSKRKQNGTNACAKDNGGCEQLCLFNGTHPVCVCSHGRISADGKTCEAFESFVMYSRVVSIDSIQMMGDKNLQNSPQPSIRNNTMLKNAIGLSFSYKHQRLFYSDIQRGSINAVFFNGTDHKVVVDRQGSVEGLAYEQVHNSLYWTCNIDATINRVNLTDEMGNSSAVETIVSMRQQDKPRGIAIDSCGNRVYWTNWHAHQPSVERAYLTGFGREAIIETDIRMPNAITLDHKAQKLYWGDARLDKIERCEYDGTKRVVLAKVTPQHPFALAVYGDFIYWTDWILHAVIRADKFTGQYVVLLRRDVARPMGIVTVANDTEDCFSNACLVQNGFCEEICGLTASGQVECSCREGRVLSEDGRCQAQTLMNCTNNGDSFRCSDGGCVPFHLTCDNIAHCADSSDEEPGYCGYRTCPLGWFACRNRRCVFANLTCDGVDDCGDSTDERDCSCAPGQFRCGDGTCIEAAHRCDNEPDCRDRSDEIGCAMPNCVETQGKDFVNCERTTACIHKDWFCDNEDDCWDNSDEANCTVVRPICERGYFRCSNGACVDMTARCDGRADCHDAELNDGVSSDELNCGPDNKCRYDQFLCDNGSTCIPLSLQCNGEKDCPDNSDEFNCKQHCHTDQFQCGNKDCIPKSWQCDGNPDCPDQSDESEHCQKTSCPKYEFRCNSTGRCIPLTWMCDGEADCQDGADEHILQGCAFNSCSESKFSCADGQCIDTIYYCDGDRDCADGSDEPSDCYKTCLAGEFQCANEKCVADLMRCDGKDDCGDGSDEEGCETTQEEEEEQDAYCKGGGWFRCENGVCINETLLCNGENNCGDFSDEAKCGIDECSASPPPCAQICVDKPVGYECRCKQGYRVDPKDRHRCDDVDECAQKPCSQVCRNTRGSYHCSCRENYVLHADKKSCRANSTVKVSLVLANRYYIRELDLSGHSSLLAHNLTNAVALDYDWQEQCIYWSDVTQLVSSIKRLCDYKNNRSATEAQTLHSPTLQNPDGLAVDWIGRNLYWCDKGLDTIEVSSLSGDFRKVLHSKGLEEPRALALDPTRGYMYWSDWGTRVHIGKAAMDGSKPRSIVTANLGWPNALTISYETEELFWADAREDYIAVADLEGRHVRIVASRQKQPRLQLHHVFAIDVWEEHVYWTDWETKSVERCNKYSGEDGESILSTVHRPMDIRVVHPFRQPGRERNPCAAANCSALCLLVPEEPFYTCACPENFVLGDDGRSCEANCTSAHFECRTSLRCIPFWWKCDTQDDCGDGSDEPADCPKFQCRPGQYQCKNGHCIHPSDLCNGKDDCGDKSDESECEHYSCLNTQFRCEGNGTVPPVCITSKQRCNKIVDCALGEDEADCPPATCPPNQFKCDNDKCIPTVWVCDRDNDCLDNSDEQQDCDSRTCGPQHIRCNSGRCIPKTWLCDGDHDCAEGEDEPPTCSRPEYHTCEPSYFKCTNNKCIPGRWRCDYEEDCGDGSDELGCEPRNCSESEFRCQNGRCIRGDLKCDGEYQCDDRSDEVDCHTQCKDNEFQCSNPKLCIFLSWKCDGETDCPDGSDEANCTESCPHNGFKCADGACVNEQWRCDGHNDCDDGSDERACFSIACPAGRFRCKSHRCVPMFALCDGKNQCGDGSDEDKHICRRYGLCPSKQFTCKNGRCIDATLKCDGSNDCADDSDETDCPTSACKWDTCSQICVETRQNQTTCKCVAGYQNTEAGNCQALGGLANLVLAVEAELRLVSPYKFGIDTDVKTLATAPGYKVDAVDILSAGRQAETFWTDHQNKRVQSMIIQIDKDGRANRDADVAKTVLSNLHDPRGLTLDWIARRIYITDGSRILAATFDGAYSYTLASGNMHQPRSIVVSPAHGLVFWADWGGPGARIETAHMDGYKRRVLVASGVLWPTDLAMDHAGGRLYWADPKTMTVESVKVDGSDRRVVRSFELDTRPYKIEIFEDNLFVSSLHKHDLFRMNKFGKGNVTYLSQGLTRISDILILHESKHPKMPNSCTDYCNDSEFCLLTPSSATCTCADGFVKDNLTCRAASAKPAGCPLNCHTGTCKVVQGRGPKCVCPPQYSGANCEHYRCSQYCKNHGLCYVDANAKKSPDEPAPLKCNCPPLWTGERCETLVDVCVNWCYNGGNCTSKSGDPHCRCPFGFSGNRCQACFDFHCENGGVCTVKNAGGDGRRSCSCPPGYTGPRCEVSLCGKHGRPIGSAGGFKCSCTSGYRGDKCELNGCDKHCLNGGTCKMGTKEPVCTCPPLFTGRRCETKMCTERYPPAGCSDNCQCQHGGVCVKPNEDADDLVCQCPLLWGGLKCETYILGSNPCKNRCLNNGVCVLPSQGGRAVCHCTKRWTGDNCEVPVECASFCRNGGSCSLNTTDRNPFCVCPNGYKGAHCEEVPYDLDAHSGKESRGIWVPVISAVAVVVVVLLAGFLLSEYFFKNRTSFAHARLQENDFSNPIFQERDAEPFTLDADKSSNFANPVYESMYNATPSGKDEKAVLLEHSVDETPPQTSEEN